jgi:predicted ribosome quality control (RQC) complex YloA/Tae2 family protein
MRRRKFSLNRGKSENAISTSAVTRKTSAPPSGELKPRMTSDPMLQDKGTSRIAGLFRRAQSKSPEVPGGDAAAQEQLHLLRRASDSAQEMNKELRELRELNAEMGQLLRQQYVEIEALTSDKVERDLLDEEHESYRRLERSNSFLMDQRIAIACRKYAAETETRLERTQEELRSAQEELRRTVAQQRDMLARFQELSGQWESANKTMGDETTRVASAQSAGNDREATLAFLVVICQCVICVHQGSAQSVPHP